MKNKWKNRNFLVALRNSFNGIKYVLKTQRNIKIQLFFALLAIIMGIIFKISFLEFEILVITIFFVLVSETINTAIEATVDMYTEEFNEKAKIAKDVAAGAVLVSSLSSVIIGLLIFLPKILQYIF